MDKQGTGRYWQNGYSDAKLRKDPSFGNLWTEAQKTAYNNGYMAGDKQNDPEAA